MKLPKILFYLALGLLTTVLIGGKLYRPRVTAPPVQQLEKETSPGEQHLPNLSTPKPESRENLVDPFRRLPEELEVMVASPEGVTFAPEPSPLPEPAVAVSYPRDSYLRGILLGKVPQALVEEAGEYRQVSLGSTFAGGVIVEINEKQLVIRRDGSRVSFKLGEE